MDSPSVAPAKSKDCPLCCTAIPERALVCRYCRRDLPAPVGGRGAVEGSETEVLSVRSGSFWSKFAAVFAGLPPAKGR